MGRLFDGVDDRITMSNGTVSWNGATAATSIAAILIRGANNTYHAIWGAYTGANSWVWGLEITDNGTPSNLLVSVVSATNAWRGPGIATTDGWVVCGISAPNGLEGASARFHKYVYSTDTWTHVDGTNNSTAGTGGTATTSRIGIWESADFYSGTIETVGVWNRSLSDAEWEYLPHSLMNWHALAPDALWSLNQASTSDTVRDLTGNGATQSAITGTAVATANTPIFNAGMGPLSITRNADVAPPPATGHLLALLGAGVG